MTLSLRHPADLEIGDTAGWETCATPVLPAPVKAAKYPGQSIGRFDGNAQMRERFRGIRILLILSKTFPRKYGASGTAYRGAFVGTSRPHPSLLPLVAQPPAIFRKRLWRSAAQSLCFEIRVHSQIRVSATPLSCGRR
jgi:hypothetical protein